MKTRNLFLQAIALASISGSVHAATYAINVGSSTLAPTISTFTQTTYSNVDFDNNSSGDVWNNIGGLPPNVVVSGIQDLTGNATGYTFSLNGVTDLNNNDANAPTSVAWANSLDIEHTGGAGSIFNSLYYTNEPGGANFIFGGFNANETDITIEVLAVLSGGVALNYTVGGTTVSHDRTTYFGSNDANDAVITFNNVTADASGNVTLNAQAGFSVVQGFRVTTTPEPSSTALIGFGALALILRRRK